MKNNYILGGSVSCFDLYNLERQFKEIHEAPIDLWSSLFQSVTPRTAGFNTADLTSV